MNGTIQVRRKNSVHITGPIVDGLPATLERLRPDLLHGDFIVAMEGRPSGDRLVTRFRVVQDEPFISRPRIQYDSDVVIPREEVSV